MKSSHFKKNFRRPHFLGFPQQEIFCSWAWQLCFGLKTELFISILVTQPNKLSPSLYLLELRAILGFSQGIHMPVSHSAYYPT